MRHINQPLNIIYINSAEKGASGGIKTIYCHSNLINKLKLNNITSEILYIKKRKLSKWKSSIKKMFKIQSNEYYGWTTKDVTVVKNFKSKWLINNAKVKNNFTFVQE